VVQSLGAIEVEPCMDIACGASYKWLMGPYGVGLFYVSKELMNEADFPFIGHNSIEYDETERFESQNAQLKKGARRFEAGNVHSLYSPSQRALSSSPPTARSA